MINVISLNVNGLKHRQQQLSKLIFEQHLDIICLQEIHDFSKEQIHNLEKQLSCTFYSDTNKGWTGTGILVKGRLQNFKIEHCKITTKTLANRITHVQIHTKRIFDIICVYAPADHTESKPFYDDFINYLKSYINHNLIMCGDFNFVNSEIDREPKLTKYDKRVSKLFKPKNYHLNDTFRIKNPTSIEFTHKTARLDRIYVSDSILNTLHKVKHLNFVADHKPVMSQLNIEDIQFWGKFYWKLNNYYLNDIYYQNEINTLLNDYDERKTYMTPIENWEYLKIQIQKKSKSFANTKANQRKL